MPIRINLLAEAQAAEELRRRDPVKRVVVIAVLAVAGMLVWWSTLQMQVMMVNRQWSSMQYKIDSETNSFQIAQANNAQISAEKGKLSDLKKLTNARMLQGNLLNALQKVTVDNVQLTVIKVEQAYIEQKGKNQSVTERTVVTLDGRDSSFNPGDQVGKFKAALAAQPYFKQMLDPTNSITLIDESSPQQDPSGKTFVLFTLQCHFPDKKR
jgi:hypothetical protein